MSIDLKNVVVIGGASGGAYCARELEKTLPSDYRMVLIEKNEMSYWQIAGLRAAVKPGECISIEEEALALNARVYRL
jgi:NADH dehydrogenase FAD-containing subunit